MPYQYAFVRAIAPNYLRVPSKDEQFKYEMRLERHLRSFAKLGDKWNDLDVGANDVPLDPNGLAAGPIPEHAKPLDQSRRFGGNGDDAVPWWLQGERKIPNLSSFKAPPYAVIADRIKRHAGVALVGSFVAGPEAQGRRFAITTDARLIPADKLKADSGSPFHGVDIRGVGLPVAFASKSGADKFSDDSQDELAPRTFVALTGKVRQRGKSRLVETRDGAWLKSDQLRTASKPGDLPWFAKGTTKWIDVSILAQTLVLWEGATPVYATLVSTGKDAQHPRRHLQDLPEARDHDDGLRHGRPRVRASRRPLGHVLRSWLRPPRRLLARRLRQGALPRLRQPRAHRRALRLRVEHPRRAGALARGVRGGEDRRRDAGEYSSVVCESTSRLRRLPRPAVSRRRVRCSCRIDL
jgi:hypothetical protein